MGPLLTTKLARDCCTCALSLALLSLSCRFAPLGLPRSRRTRSGLGPSAATRSAVALASRTHLAALVTRASSSRLSHALCAVSSMARTTSAHRSRLSALCRSTSMCVPLLSSVTPMRPRALTSPSLAAVATTSRCSSIHTYVYIPILLISPYGKCNLKYDLSRYL